MAQDWRPGQSIDDYEVASRLLLRRLAETSDRMNAAEPGTDDFLIAYDESRRLRDMYRRVRDTWRVPAEVWAMAPDEFAVAIPERATAAASRAAR